MSSPEKEKRCLYEVLSVSRDCSADEIRSAYKKLALQRHPDKLIKSGLSEAEATALFQELVNAYEVLSDPRERAWYDSHRSQILFSGAAAAGNSSSASVYVPNLFPYFSNSIYSGYSDSGKGFYKVYADAFDKIYQNELNFGRKMGVGLPKEAPLMGNLESPYAQVTAFYNYWTGFVTVMDFCWVDQYDVMAGPNRKSRRVMEEENKKLRKKARREYNETVRGLAEFAKKRDKRVIDMHLKRSEEMERKREEERKRKEELARLKAEKARMYEEPEWARVEEVEDEEFEDTMEENDNKGKENELYCVACGKKFKSDKQWKNHEQSKKHKERVAELREAFDEEDGEYEEVDNTRGEEIEEDPKHEERAEVADAVSSTDDGADELVEQFGKQMGMGEDNHEAEFTGNDGLVCGDSDTGPGDRGLEVAEDDETSFLEDMVSGQMNRKKAVSKKEPKFAESKVQLEADNDGDYREYNNTKGSRRSKGGRRRQRGRIPEEESRKNSFAQANGHAEENIRPEDGSRVNELSPNSLPEDGSRVNELSPNSLPENHRSSRESDNSEVHKISKEKVEKKNAAKQDNSVKSREAAKGRKKKASAEVSSNACETCGEKFESRNKLHKHLGDTGHSALRSR